MFLHAGHIAAAITLLARDSHQPEQDQLTLMPLSPRRAEALPRSWLGVARLRLSPSVLRGVIADVTVWKAAAYEIVGRTDVMAEVAAELLALQEWAGGPLPAAVEEWFRFGGDQRLDSVSCNRITRTENLTGPTVARFLESGYLLLETDSQECCRWVVPVPGEDGDPPVYLIDPEDDACASRSRYADTFSDYAFTTAWDAVLWSGELSAEFDHPLPPGALFALGSRLTRLPETYGWAMNQGCDRVYRFDGSAKVAVAVADGVALWSAISAPSNAMREAFAEIVGAPV
ncbi:hypothetical protein [Actinoplanes sp. CA-252034]|uniref:hypothetical protein n=1 Tax=Actinoplanes sp. CA-252034 TaxID=3239906 RepID=UPI003D964CF8